MIACLSPADNNYDESLSTLRYANRAKNISNRPKINEDPKDAMLRQYQEEIKQLRLLLSDPSIAAKAAAANNAFSGESFFQGCAFSGVCLFRGVPFQGCAFSGVYLCRGVPFHGCAFSGVYLFRGVPFQGCAFSGVCLSRMATFITLSVLSVKTG